MVSPGMTGSSGAGEVRLSAIGEAWSVVQKNLGVWIVATLIYLVTSGLFQGVENNISKNSPLLGLIMSLISLVVSSFLAAGMYRMALNQLNNGTTSVGDLFSEANAIPALVGATILATIGIIVGLVFLIIPGLILAGLLMFYTLLIVDKREGALSSLTLSFHALKPHIGGVIVYLLAIIGINLLGLLACGLGLLVSVPVTIISTTIIYRDFFLGGTSVSSDTNLFPPIPQIPPRAQ